MAKHHNLSPKTMMNGVKIFVTYYKGLWGSRNKLGKGLTN